MASSTLAFLNPSLRRDTSRLTALALACGLCLALLFVPSPAAEAQYADSFGKNKVQYRDFEWLIYHSPHFDVYYYVEEEEQLEKVVSFAESAYDELSRELDFQIQEPVPLIFYATHSAFEQNNIILNFIPEGVGAFASPVRNRMVLPVDLPDPELLALIKHELTHIFQYEMLFSGSLARGLAVNPPLWLMEGMASYFADDETTPDRMYLRDAVVNDLIPSIATTGVNGFFAYRFGHAAFDYMEERWGKDGLLDFLYEFRNTIGGRADRAIERAFKLDAEDFDRDFRRWLRAKYLPELVETGEPSDFGRRFRVGQGLRGQAISPVASPSGDLVAAIGVYQGDLDILLFDGESRRLIRNLTEGYATEYQYISSQFLTNGRQFGRDLAFSPDGNYLAAFVKRERSRSVILVNVVKGGVERIIDLWDVEQPLNPTWSADGRTLAFSANRDGKFDIFQLNLETLEVSNVTDDELYNGSPTYSPDGRTLVYSKVVGDFVKLFQVNVDDPSKRFQLTFGESNEYDAVYSPTGDRIYFTSDSNGVDNIYGLDLATGERIQYTDVVTGTFMPAVLPQPNDRERIVYSGYWKGNFDLYLLDTDAPISEPVQTEFSTAAEPVVIAELPAFEPDIQVAIDDANKEEYGDFSFFLENADGFIGVDDDQTVLGRVILTFSDYLGDKRLIGIFDSQNSLANFDVRYLDLQDRLQWQVRLFDVRSFFVFFDNRNDDVDRLEEQYQLTGVQGSVIYPFSFNQRAEAGVGYFYRKFTRPVFGPNFSGDPRDLDFIEFEDDFPLLFASLVGDNAVYAATGPISGSRWRVDASYSPDLDDSGTLYTILSVDGRRYIPVTRRSSLALRLYGSISDGNNPAIFGIGGLDTIRGFDFRELTGDRVAFANVEYRFPLVDFLATPVVSFQGIQGRFFFDIGAAWFDENDFDFYDSDESQLRDGVASYGFGVTANFLGLPFNWDFSKQWNFDESTEGFRTDFYIGSRF
ncbi:MAG: BamA/TamA family outer membrane protein [Acidobacteriota bacterium]